MFSSSVQRGPHVAECDLLRSLAPGLSSLSNGGRFGKDATGLILLLGVREFADLLRQPNGAVRFVMGTYHLANASLTPVVG